METKESKEYKSEVSNNKWIPIISILLVGILSEGLYLALLKLDAVNGFEPVFTFWAEMIGLFIFYAIASLIVFRYKNLKRYFIWVILIGAVLFRLTLLPAGLPFDYSTSEKLEALQSDVNGTEVTYEQYQLFDNDIWRYLWDGHVYSHGINPYLYAPNDKRVDKLTNDFEVEIDGETSSEKETDSTENEVEEFDDSYEVLDLGENEQTKESVILEESKIENTDSGDELTSVPNGLNDGIEIWADIRENVNYPEVTTIYPPFAQFVFRFSHFIAPGSVFVMKAILVLFELIGIFFLILTLRRLELPLVSVILYAWNPLMIKVFAGSGHADAILMAALCATAYFIVRGAKSLSAVAIGIAILAKLSPIILLLFVARRIGFLRTGLIGLVVFLGYLPFIDAGSNLFSGFLKFAQEWQFNAGLFGLISWSLSFISDNPMSIARTISALLIVGVTAYLILKDDLSDKAFISSSSIILGITIILSPTVMPWYLSWVLPFAVLSRQYIWIYFSALVLAAFHIMIDLNEYAFVLLIEHGLFYAIVAYLLLQKYFERKKKLN